MRRFAACLPFAPIVLFGVTHLVFGLWALAAPTFRTLRTVYDSDTLVFPCLFLVGAVATRYVPRRTRALNGVLVLNLMFAAGAPAARAYATHIEPKRLVVHQERIESPRALRALRVVHISDIQSDVIGAHEQNAFEAVRRLEPDIVLHTGDLLQPIAPATIASELPKLERLVHGTPAKHGFVTVLGDVDGWVARKRLRHVAGMRVLHSESLLLDAAGTQVAILGLSLHESRRPELARLRIWQWLDETPREAFKIVLGHAPDYMLQQESLPVDLALAGHTHGGQVRIPFFGPPITLSRVPRDWARGFRRVGSSWLNVSAGIGSEHSGGLPAIRINCPPEITMLSFVPAGR